MAKLPKGRATREWAANGKCRAWTNAEWRMPNACLHPPEKIGGWCAGTRVRRRKPAARRDNEAEGCSIEVEVCSIMVEVWSKVVEVCSETVTRWSKVVAVCSETVARRSKVVSVCSGTVARRSKVVEVWSRVVARWGIADRPPTRSSGAERPTRLAFFMSQGRQDAGPEWCAICAQVRAELLKVCPLSNRRFVREPGTFSRQWVAWRSGVSLANIRRMCDEELPSSPDTVERLAEFLGMKLILTRVAPLPVAPKSVDEVYVDLKRRDTMRLVPRIRKYARERTPQEPAPKPPRRGTKKRLGPE